MNKIYNLFKKYLPVIAGLSVVTTLLGLLTLIYYYNKDTVSINFANVIPICTAIFFLLAIAFVIGFIAQVNNIYISKIKKSFGFCHFAAALSAALAAALFFFDFFRFVQTPTTSSPLRILRLVAFVPFILYLILGMVPRSFHKRVIHISIKIKYVAAIGAIVWSILGLLMIYFWDGLPITNIFKIVHLFFYVLLLLFLAFEIKFEILTPMPRFYVLFSLLLFVYTTSLTGAVMLAKFFGFVEEVAISEFEIFLAFALGIYAFSKMIAIPRTIKIVKEKSHSCRHHHHHKHSNAKANDDAAGAKKFPSEAAQEPQESSAESVTVNEESINE